MKKNTSKGKSILLFILTLAVIIGSVGIAYLGIGEAQKFGAESIKLGLDLQGGVNIVYEAAIDNPTPEEMNAALEMIQLRLTKEGYTEADAAIEGTNRIRVDIPGVEDPQEAISSIGAAAMLQFVDMEGNVVFTGKDVEKASAFAYQDNLGMQQNGIQLHFNDEVTKAFGEYTKEHVGEALAITLDDQVLGAPVIQEAILTGDPTITGGYTAEEAQQMADRIQAGSLPFALNDISSNGVGAKLGMGALSSSLLAGAVGFAFIMIFMIALYRLNGLAADLALILYVAIVIMILSATGATLTLPGIAGIILSIGMAVDANVIIFTRIKEELTLGKSTRSAVDAGFSKAFSAILDGNITTLIAAVVLWALGTGVIRSFAQTLAIGIVVSMFTALVVTKNIVKLFIGMGAKKKSLFMSAKAPKESKIKLDIISNRKKYFILSSALILIGLLAMPINAMRGEGILEYDIEFKGGAVMQIDMGRDVDPTTEVMPIINEVIEDAGARIQKVADSNEIVITMQPVDDEKREALYNALAEAFELGDKKDHLHVDNFVSPSISDEFKVRAIEAVLLGAALMLIYITVRFNDFKFGASAVLALLHNVLIMLGVYALFRIPLNNSFIAAMLTIIGYSINDTIIIFDRIRENKGRVKGKPEEIINISIGQTLTRSINTSITTVVMVALLLGFGEPSVKQFAFPIVIGILAGTYSSIFIASPLWYVMSQFARNRKLKQAEEVK